MNSASRPLSTRILRASVLPCAALSFLLAALPVRADSLDFMLDVLYKAGVIDGNVKAAKPLIFCLADGKSVPDCTIGAAGQTELANDPEVRNVVEIYQSFQQKDYYAVVKKAGVTVGCALIPGGQIKDVLCGEIAKMALVVINGVGTVLGSVGDAVSSLFGGGDQEAPPMPDEDYYRLYFAPAYHKLVMAVDAGDGSAQSIVQAIHADCKAYYSRFEQYASNGCEANAPRLLNQAIALHETLLAEGDSWFRLRSEPKIESWAREHFGEDSTIYVSTQLAECRASIQKAIALPDPGFDRCDIFKNQMQQMSFFPSGAIDEIDNQCRAQAQTLAILPPHDAFAMACDTVQKTLPVRLLAAMAAWKTRMNLAQGAGCWNEGTPDTIHCDTYASQLACVKAIPDKVSICGFDVHKADQNFAQEVFSILYAETAKTGKPQHCLRTDAQVLCFRPVKQQGCKIYTVLHGSKYGLSSMGDSICLLQSDAEYDQLKSKAQQVLAALNAQKAAAVGDTVVRRVGPVMATARSQQANHAGTLRPSIRFGRSLSSDIDPAAPCSLAVEDPLKIVCKPDFQWDGQPARDAQVVAILGAALDYCAADYEADGADIPCRAGTAVGAFPKGANDPPPAQPPAGRRPALAPAVDRLHPPGKVAPSLLPVIAPVEPVSEGDH